MDGKEWTVKIENVTAEDMSNFVEKAGKVGLSVGELLGHFVNDLIGGDYSNGSDERMYAAQWFDRCGFSHFSENTFLKYLLEWDYLKDVWRVWWQIDYCKEDIARTQRDIERGYMEYQGQRYTWEDVTEGGKPSYSSREEWEAQQREYIEEYKEDMKGYKETLEGYWTEYQEFSKQGGNFDDEMKAVIEWVQKNKDYLDID